MKYLDKILKIGDGRRFKRVQSVVEPVNNLEPEIQKLSDSELKAKTGEFKSKLENGSSLDDIMVEAFAVVREASNRVIGQRHYDVQVLGGAALHWGSVAEMKTGEGKTLVSTLPVYLNALNGKGVHVITVNDYLASRDAEWMGQIHGWLGLSTGLITSGSDQDSAQKRAQYASDITYGTNNEFGFDYLRDNMAKDLESMVQRGHIFAIVDEIDSILIDEARTPLIISGRVQGQADLYYRFSDVASQLKKDVDYEVDEEKRIVSITDEGVSRVEEILEIDNLYDGVKMDFVHQLLVSLKAKELFKRDKDYVVQDGKIKIVDEFTGRILDGRRWSDGLHQAVEAKERVKIKDEQQTLATVTLQNYFRLYEKLSGMTGTAMADAAEMDTTYGLAVIQVPTNKPVIRKDKEDLIYKTENAKFSAVIDDIEKRVQDNQPILVGTASVEKSEKLSELMVKRGLAHEVLNAKQHYREADIVAQAGKPGAVTVATNMAGRGVDIILGGNYEKLAEADVKAEGLDIESEEGKEYYSKRLEYWKPICDKDGEVVREAGGLYVLGTERHESRRIDNQLRGRSGRQGDPGESRFYLSLEDDLMRIFATGAANWVMGRALPDDVPIEAKVVSKAVERAQTTVEQKNAEIRKNVLKYDEVYDQQRKVIYKRRMQILEGKESERDTKEAIWDVAAYLTSTYCVEELEDTWDLDGLVTEVRNFWDSELEVEDFKDAEKVSEVDKILYDEGEKLYDERQSELGEEEFQDIENQVMLQLVDQRWRDHLTEMAELKDGINLRSIGQRDPLTEWQSEGYDIFKEMMESLNIDFIRYVMKIDIKPTDESSEDNSEAVTTPETTDIVETKPSVDGTEETEPESQTVIKDEWDKTPRNAACPCGSGKKFKVCHGRR